MVFNVCFNPKVIEVAVANGPYAMQALIAMFRGFSANCVLFDFEDTRLQRGIDNALNALPPRDERSELKRIVEQMKRRNRFAAVMPDPNWESQERDIQHALWQKQAFCIQLFITDGLAGTEVGCADLASYQQTALERERFVRATNGHAFAGGELDETGFLTSNFANALRHARRIQICDGILGRKFAANFEHTVQALLRWMEAILHQPPECEVVIHTERAAGREDHLCHMVRSFRRGRLAQTGIKVTFYENAAGNRALPHDRFLWTDQFAFDIGRGMDFLDQKSRKNRDVSINLKGTSEISAAMARYAGNRIETREL